MASISGVLWIQTVGYRVPRGGGPGDPTPAPVAAGTSPAPASTPPAQVPPPVPAPGAVAPGSSAAPPATGSPATPPAAPGSGGGILHALGEAIKGLVSAIAHLFGSLFGGGSSASTPATPAAASGAGAPAGSMANAIAGVDDATLAQRYGLLAAPDNVAAFRQEMASYDATPGVLSPASTDATAIRAMQGQLGRAGAAVPVTGQYDAATQQAVITFKARHGLHQTYKLASGAWAINQVLDPATKAALDQLAPLQGTPPAAPPSQPATPPAPPPVSVPATPAGPVVPAAQAPPAPSSAAPVAAAAQPRPASATAAPAGFVPNPIQPLPPSQPTTGPAIPMVDPVTGQAVASTTANGIQPGTPSQPTTGPAIPMVDPVTGQAIAPATPTQPVATAQPATPQAAPSQPTAAASPASVQAFAAQYGLYPTADNVAAFQREMTAAATDGSMMAGCTDTASVLELQRDLTKLGYPVTGSGQYDQATAIAVARFKVAHGLHQTYVDASGHYAVSGVADRQTLSLVLQMVAQAH